MGKGSVYIILSTLGVLVILVSMIWSNDESPLPLESGMMWIPYVSSHGLMRICILCILYTICLSPLPLLFLSLQESPPSVYIWEEDKYPMYENNEAVNFIHKMSPREVNIQRSLTTRHQISQLLASPDYKSMRRRKGNRKSEWNWQTRELLGIPDHEAKDIIGNYPMSREVIQDIYHDHDQGKQNTKQLPISRRKGKMNMDVHPERIPNIYKSGGENKKPILHRANTERLSTTLKSTNIQRTYALRNRNIDFQQLKKK